MARRTLLKRRFLERDSKYNNILVNLLINRLLKQGKKRLAKKIVYKAFTLVESITKINPIFILEKSIRRISPQIQIKNQQNDQTANYVPTTLNIFRSTNLAIRWLVEFSRKRLGRDISLKLANEIIDSYNGLGNAIKKKKKYID